MNRIKDEVLTRYRSEITSFYTGVYFPCVDISSQALIRTYAGVGKKILKISFAKTLKMEKENLHIN